MQIQTSPEIEGAGAALLLAAPRVKALRYEAERLSRVLTDLGQEVLACEGDGASLLHIITSGTEVLVTYRSEPLADVVTDACGRPAEGEAEDGVALTRLSRHMAVLSLSVRDPRGTFAGRARHLDAIAQRLVRVLLDASRAGLVLWERSATLYTAEEFRVLRGRDRVEVETRDLARDAGEIIAVRKRPRMLEAEGAGPAESPFSEGTARLDRVVPRRPSLPRLSDPAPLSKAHANEEPDLPGPMSAEYERLKDIFRSAEVPRDGCLAADKDATMPGRLSVYVLTGATMVISFPVGMGLMTYNILKGESLNVSARVLAMTGTLVGFKTLAASGSLGSLAMLIG